MFLTQPFSGDAGEQPAHEGHIRGEGAEEGLDMRGRRRGVHAHREASAGAGAPLPHLPALRLPNQSGLLEN